MAEIKWNQDALQRVVKSGFEEAAAKMQAVLDSVRVSEQGKSAEAVKGTLATRWRSDLGMTPSDEFLQKMAEQLAAGTRVVLRPDKVPPIEI
jgi:hypothetical protein